ncbi:hypothetical protein CGRA01v4_05029 [Colletotrichum graminicola]|nr:hypothetical protein CGRA01v4_05029 [Colletotrichum graminicola]
MLPSIHISFPSILFYPLHHPLPGTRIFPPPSLFPSLFCVFPPAQSPTITNLRFVHASPIHNSLASSTTPS